MPTCRLHTLAVLLAAFGLLGCDHTTGSVGGATRGSASPTSSARNARAAHFTCENGADPHLQVVERAARPGGRIRILAVSEAPLGEAVLLDGQDRFPTLIWAQEAGPPYVRLYESRAVHAASPTFRLVTSPRRVVACVRARVTAAPLPAATWLEPDTGIWQARRGWNDTWERLFSAWIAYLFRSLPERPAGWRPLHQVLRDPRRNLLYNRLGLREDDTRAKEHIVAVADCGDTPYQLRAYFAWKFSLPFRFQRCTRGSGLRGPRCPLHRDHRTAAFDRLRNPVKRFNAFIRRGLAWLVHSGTTRTLPEDEHSDFYPIALNRRSIRPGTIFVDVGGHVLVVTQWDHDGLYAIDGHPDFSVTRRRFQRAYFRYFLGTRTGGFKAFRPIRMSGGELHPIPNRKLERFFSVEQYRFRSRRAFYRTMSRLIALQKG